MSNNQRPSSDLVTFTMHREMVCKYTVEHVAHVYTPGSTGQNKAQHWWMHSSFNTSLLDASSADKVKD